MVKNTYLTLTAYVMYDTYTVFTIDENKQKKLTIDKGVKITTTKS